ncbi:hypothetical protein HWD97_24050 [Ochrobactrum sp. C6C9]|uniref:hypothetical protein n=1 Tax=Ochrobactrum sp. C6C9 TaxID=2736662 RepID=UPI00352FEF61|nr:hypothetical protein [Ochrobactrum sp. C6C9]
MKISRFTLVWAATAIVITTGITEARLLPAADSKKPLLQLKQSPDNWLETECMPSLNLGEQCRQGAARRVATSFFKNDYKKSRFYLDAFYRLYKANYDYAEDPCPLGHYQTKLGPQDVYYQFGYWQSKYALDIAQDTPNRTGTGLRAFLCSIIGDGFSSKRNLTEYRFTRDNFRKFVKENYRGRKDMDPEVFISEVQEPAQAMYDNITSGIVWGKSPFENLL